MQAGRTTALAQQSAAIKNQADAYELQKAQGLQAAFANGIETVAGPPDKNGKPTVAHKFNQDKFLAGLQENPAALEAYKSYVEKAYPQIQTETANQIVPNLLGTNGQVSGPQTTQAMADNPNSAGTVLSTAMNLQAAQQKSVSQAIGTNLEVGVTGAQGANNSGVGSIEANATMQPKVPGFGAGTAGTTTPADIEKLDAPTRAARARGLANLGFPPASNSSADIADASNRWRAVNVGKSLSGIDWTNAGSAIGGLMAAPAAAAQANQDATANGLGIKSGAQGIQSGALGITGQVQTQDLVQQLQRAGFQANPGNAGTIQQAKASYDWLDNTAKEIKQVTEQVAKSAMDPDQFAAKVNAFSNAPMVAESIRRLAPSSRSPTETRSTSCSPSDPSSLGHRASKRFSRSSATSWTPNSRPAKPRARWTSTAFLDGSEI
jgi:hypothetical protein